INDVKVSQNGTEYLVTFLDPFTGIVPLTANGAGLKPGIPGDLVGYTVEITKGPAKNKVRIITAAQAGNGGWVLTLDKPWLSLFTGDASVPDATSKFTLATTNPNLLVKEETLANLLYLYDTDNPASYNDAALPTGQTNPFGEGRLFFDANPFGPADSNHVVA